MRRFLRTLLFVVVVIAGWEFVVRSQITGFTMAQTAKTGKSNSEELAKLYEEDQADRMPKDGKAIDWKVIGHATRNARNACTNFT